MSTPPTEMTSGCCPGKPQWPLPAEKQTTMPLATAAATAAARACSAALRGPNWTDPVQLLLMMSGLSAAAALNAAVVFTSAPEAVAVLTGLSSTSGAVAKMFADSPVPCPCSSRFGVRGARAEDGRGDAVAAAREVRVRLPARVDHRHGDARAGDPGSVGLVGVAAQRDVGRDVEVPVVDGGRERRRHAEEGRLLDRDPLEHLGEPGPGWVDQPGDRGVGRVEVGGGVLDPALLDRLAARP